MCVTSCYVGIWRQWIRDVPGGDAAVLPFSTVVEIGISRPLVWQSFSRHEIRESVDSF